MHRTATNELVFERSDVWYYMRVVDWFEHLNLQPG